MDLKMVAAWAVRLDFLKAGLMASKKAVHGGSLVTGRHSYICGVLSTWRKVVKEGVPPDSCCEDLLLFLRRMATATAKDL